MTAGGVELIAAIIGLGTAVLGVSFEYKKHKTKRSKEEDYYKLVLQPFIKKYRKDKKLDAKRFLKNNSAIKKNNDAIPSYIYYLINEDDENDNKLTKVLWCDYCDLYVNDSKKMIGFLNGIKKTIIYIELIFAVVAASLCGMVVVNAGEFLIKKIIELVTQNWTAVSSGWNDFLQIILEGVVFMMTGLVLIWFVSLHNDDIYTLDKKKILKMIKKKEKRYSKNKEGFIV